MKATSTLYFSLIFTSAILPLWILVLCYFMKFYDNLVMVVSWQTINMAMSVWRSGSILTNLVELDNFQNSNCSSVSSQEMTEMVVRLKSSSEACFDKRSNLSIPNKVILESTAFHKLVTIDVVLKVTLYLNWFQIEQPFQTSAYQPQWRDVKVYLFRYLR